MSRSSYLQEESVARRHLVLDGDDGLGEDEDFPGDVLRLLPQQMLLLLLFPAQRRQPALLLPLQEQAQLLELLLHLLLRLLGLVLATASHVGHWTHELPSDVPDDDARASPNTYLITNQVPFLTVTRPHGLISKNTLNTQ